MAHYNDTMAMPGDVFADAAPADQRKAFIRRTYLHLAGALGAFALLEAILLNTGFGQSMAMSMMQSWWLVLIGFIAVSWVADAWARSNTSIGMQYAGLGLYVVAEAVIFLPMMYLALAIDPTIIPSAGILTALLFVGLTGLAFTTGADFSFLRGILWIVGIAALGLIFISMFVGFSLGIWFSVAMIVLAGGSILYSTSNVLHHYRTNQHVAAALALFAAVALMLWYVMRILMATSRN